MRAWLWNETHCWSLSFLFGLKTLFNIRGSRCQMRSTVSTLWRWKTSTRLVMTMIMTMMAMNKDLLSRIVTFICLTLSFGILTFVVQSHLPFLALFDLEESKKELHFLFFWLDKKKIERWESAKIVIREVVCQVVGCTCQLPGLHKVYHDDDDTYLYH